LPEPSSPPEIPRRVVPDSEYRTAYVEYFQIRFPSVMYEQLCDWARQDRILMKDLLIRILEEAVSRRWNGKS